LSLIAVLGSAHCGGNTAHNDTTTDAGADISQPSPDAPNHDVAIADSYAGVDATRDARADADGALCCSISATLGCCMEYGGSLAHPAHPFGCETVCDGMPPPTYPGWEKRIDADGCPYWWFPPDAPRECGFVLPDVRADVDADAVAPPGGDAQSNLDAHHDGDAVACCPIGPAP